MTVELPSSGRGRAACVWGSSSNKPATNGLHITDAWNDGAQAYLWMSTVGFPNLFMVYGPNTNGGSSMILMLNSKSPL